MSLHGHDAGEERQHLASLMQDFPGAEISDVDEAIRRIQTVYQIVYDSVPTSAESLDWEQLPNLLRAFHGLLYGGILSNAGQYRKTDEPGQGYVGFGGMGRTGPPKFRGVHPDLIEE